jgi:hypothetical protein
VRLSVLTPSYQYGHFLGDALASVAAQRITPQQPRGVELEHVVVDGGSTDGTAVVLQGFTPAPVWRSEPDRGQADALNKALALATGDWIGWLNADEFFLPWSVAALAAATRAFPDADVITGDAAYVGAHGHLHRLVAHPPTHAPLLTHYPELVASCATFVRRGALRDQPWDTRLPSLMDWDLWLSLSQQGARFRHVPLPLGVYRLHEGQVTAGKLVTDTPERRTVHAAHSLPSSSSALRARHALGKGAHALGKLATGAWGREARAAALRGCDLRWFAGRRQTEAAWTLYVLTGAAPAAVRGLRSARRLRAEAGAAPGAG